MNIKSLYLGFAALAVSGALSSCSDNFLDVQPITDINDTQLMEPSVAKTALAGIYESMNTQYSGIDFNQDCGEAYINYVLNDCMGNDLISGLWNNPANTGMVVWPRMTSDTEFVCGFPWAYYYGIIAQANRIIGAIPATSTEGEVSDKSLYFYKASALTMRAHSYTKLLTFYGNRWEESSNGEAYCIVLRTEATTGNIPLSTMNQVLDQIYSDCDEAVKLFGMSGMSRSAKYEVNVDVANGVWSRAALLKHDWRTAADKAEAAMTGYKVMQGDELFAGFYNDCNDFIWEMNPIAEGTYYWSWGSHYACNGNYVDAWGFGAGAINIDLYNLLDPNDLRRQYFWMPDKLEALSKRENPGNLKADAFWNPKMVAETAFLNMTISSVYAKNNKGDNFGMIDAIVNWLNNYKTKVFKGNIAELENDDMFYNYMFLTPAAKNSKKSVRLANDAAGNQVWGTPANMPFGAQCKFWALIPYGNMAFPWMRASEMALTRAEALAELGDAGAAKAFEDFQKLRVPGYTCKSSGQALIDEIRISRRIELWGEGHNFTDLKRWNLPHIHREWKAGDVNSGNWAPGENLSEAMKSTKYSNGWRFALPIRETRYNPEVDVTLLPEIK